VLLVQLKSTDVSCGKATLRTSPSSGQATISPQLRHPKLHACHSRAAFEGCVVLDGSQQGSVALP